LWPENSIDCEFECDGTYLGETSAFEEIENYMNVNQPLPNCGPGSVWNKMFTGVRIREEVIDWIDGVFEDCSLIDSEMAYPYEEFHACKCFSGELLNCMTCELFDEIETSASPISIPSGFQFMSIDFSIDFAPSGGHPEDYSTQITLTYMIGIPICVPDFITFTEDVLTMDIDEIDP
jgi:hypothetical protein